MVIIDAQVDIWPPETPDRPYIKEDASKPHRPAPLGPEELLREEAIYIFKTDPGGLERKLYPNGCAHKTRIF